MAEQQRPLIVHVIYRLGVGGLENGLVNLINHLPEDAYRHAIVCLDEFTGFRSRIRRHDVEVVALHKAPGADLPLYVRLWSVFRRLRPDLVHTRNLPALDATVVATLAGIPARIHGEHGRDMTDLMGTRRKYLALRQAVRPFIDAYVAVSSDLADWLVNSVRISPDRVHRIPNGVDTERFRPRTPHDESVVPGGPEPPRPLLVGTVGRMADVKDQVTLAESFVLLRKRSGAALGDVKLALVGDGPLRERCLSTLRQAGLSDSVWAPGERNDIPAVMRSLDVFVLPSVAEGMSNTILEAMATGLPVVATRVGGNAELVVDGRTGALVPARDPGAMADALAQYCHNRGQRVAHGIEGRRIVERTFSLDAMTRSYDALYRRVLRRHGAAAVTASATPGRLV